jgi:hypothetical protein
VIKLGEGWIAEGHCIFHECSAGVRVELPAERELCDCGVSVPRRVRHFEDWLAGGRRGLLIEALLDDGNNTAVEDLEPEV